ncbi:MAG: ABC-type cobalamin/Fe(3+)-siderophores transport system ATPase component [Candidatus Methanohalarchaeum thermophilum]|uniref:ABC-type cobalamin/Fe(3+)-siderophores transport system ATPase component n=1 Tax=Methanohalarchaeum thermophilum TaxID=1903181 RepID=A0A1Q6DT02_METT1|nr:MAG: ABC-type cobalamin/Fe(3+)-siderophores transport system ATPase component [Candidatus Methanohalarchaeum thermophilum]
MIDINNLNFSYNEEKVLKEINLEIGENRLIGVIGPNGSGKTTLIKCLTGINPVSDNEIFLGGNDISNLKRKDIAKYVSVVPQNTRVNFNFKVKEVISMGRLAYRSLLETSENRNENKEAVEEAMRLTETTEFKDRMASNLSGGQLQRVIIARALAQDTPILLLDEPTSHLDINHKIEIMSLAKDLSKEKLVIGVFHDLNLAAQYCDKLILLNQGKVKAKGDPGEVLRPKIIRESYGVNTIVKKHPIIDSVFVTPCAEEICEEDQEEKNVHVIAGMGSGSKIFYELNKRGYKISAGVINSLDTDTETADSMGIPVVKEKPFSAITEEKYQKNLDLIEEADAVVVSNLKFGEGNLKNLKALKYALDKDKKVISLSEDPIKERDHTKDYKATQLYKKLKEKGMKEVNNINKLIEEINHQDIT